MTETHQVAEAQQEKNAKLREAFGISKYFVDGSSFDPDREAKEQLAKSAALQEKERQRILLEKEKEGEKAQGRRYDLVHTPSPEPPDSDGKTGKKKKKRKDRCVQFYEIKYMFCLIDYFCSVSSEEAKKKKKSKKRKKEK